MVRPVALGAVVVLTIGCGSFSAAEKPADDAGANGTDAGTVDDGGMPLMSDAAASSPCKGSDPTIVFCEDFDDPAYATPPFRFADVTINPAATGTIALANVGVGGTHGAVVELATSGGSRSVWLGHDLGINAPGINSRYELAYDVEVMSSTLQYAALGTFAFFGGAGYALYPGVAVYTAGSALGGTADPGSTPPLFTTNVLGTWHHVVVTVTRGGVRYDVAIAVDGASVGKPAPVEMARVDDVRIQLGAFFTGTDLGEGKLVLDNVVVRTTR